MAGWLQYMAPTHPSLLQLDSSDAQGERHTCCYPSADLHQERWKNGGSPIIGMAILQLTSNRLLPSNLFLPENHRFRCVAIDPLGHVCRAFPDLTGSRRTPIEQSLRFGADDGVTTHLHHLGPRRRTRPELGISEGLRHAPEGLVRAFPPCVLLHLQDASTEVLEGTWAVVAAAAAVGAVARGVVDVGEGCVQSHRVDIRYYYVGTGSVLREEVVLAVGGEGYRVVAVEDAYGVVCEERRIGRIVVAVRFLFASASAISTANSMAVHSHPQYTTAAVLDAPETSSPAPPNPRGSQKYAAYHT